MRVVITLEDTYQGLATDALVMPNDVSVDAHSSLAMLVALTFNNHLARLRELGTLRIQSEPLLEFKK